MNTERIKELARIAANPLAFLEYVRIQEPGELSVKYEMWPHLVEFNRVLETEKYVILIKTKQAGASWTLAARALRRLCTTVGEDILLLSAGEKESRMLLGKVRVIWQNLPEWLKQFSWGERPKYYTLEPNSGEQMGLKELGSEIVALPSTEKAGIGHTSGLVIQDEAEFHDYFEVNLGHILATVADAPSRQLVIVSTIDPTRPDSPFKRLFKGARGSGYPEAGSNPFRALFWTYDVRPGRGEAFYQEQIQLNQGTPWVVKSNYPRSIEEALSPLGAQSCFNHEKLEMLWNDAVEPLEIRQGFIHIFYPPRVGTQYLAGVDVGEGVGLDYSCLTIVGKEGLNAEVVATIYSNTIGTDAFAFEVDRLCREYHVPLLVVDNIGVGRAVIDKLEQLGYPNLFYPDAEKKKKAGWSLTRANKRELAVKLVELINNRSLITRWKPQIQELMEYQWINGYPEPTGKTHGDTVIPLELICAVWQRFKQPEPARLFRGGRQIW